MSRCSYCHGRGHNRVGCPDRKLEVERHRREMADGMRDWSSLVEEEEKYQKRKGRARKCSYCYNRHGLVEHDHNRRNCPRLVEDKAKLASENKEWREQALKVIKQYGLGVGAIIHDESYYGQCVITAVHWNNISCTMNGYYNSSHVCFTITSLESMAKGHNRDRGISLPRFGGYNTYQSLDMESIKVTVPASERFIDADIPEGWIEGEMGLDMFFTAESDKWF